MSNKARQIKDTVKMWHLSPLFSAQRMTESNPFNQIIMVDGIIVPLSTFPEDLQEMVKDVRVGGEDI